MKVFYEILRFIGVVTGFPFNFVAFKKKTYYENKKKQGRFIKGGAVIVSNHYNPLDYVSNSFVVFPKKLNVVASEDAFRNPLISFGMKFFGGIKADRRTYSLKFVDESAAVAKKGQLVQIFPEGHNTPDGTIKRFYPSYILIAIKAGVPIIPIISDGRYGIFKRLHVIIGEKIEVSDYLNVENYTREDVYRANEIIRNKIIDLKTDLDRRAGNPQVNNIKGNTEIKSKKNKSGN